MLRTDTISLHVPEPLALIDATLLFTVQVLLARHPELLLPPEGSTPPETSTMNPGRSRLSEPIP